MNQQNITISIFYGCVTMPQPLDDVYLWETFQKGLHLKLKMEILKNYKE
jgi:hypothetical protein